MLTLFSGDAVHDHDAWIHEISKHIAQVTVLKLTATAVNMNADELRGYIRSRAASDVRLHVRQAIEQRRLPQSQETRLASAVLERVVHLVARDVLAQPTATIPTPHIPTRRAA